VGTVSARHHLVPQFYLRNFANAGQQVVLVDRDHPSRRVVNAVRRACSEVGFYRIETEVLAREEDRTNHDPEIVEFHLSQFERAAAPAVYKILRTGWADLTKEDRYHLINHIAIQTVRGHRWREDFNANATQAARMHLGETVTDETIRGWLKETNEPHGPAEINQFRIDMVALNGFKVTAPDVVLIQEGLKLALGPLGERLVDNMEWSLVASETVRLLTSDEPVCWWAPGDGPVGYGSTRVVWFPLSPGLAIQMHDGDTTPEELGLPSQSTAQGRAELCRLINLNVAAQAHRWIVHHPADEPLQGVELPPRTEWADELVEVQEGGRERRELWIHRRLPVART
jgi:hypothetical protein